MTRFVPLHYLRNRLTLNSFHPRTANLSFFPTPPQPHFPNLSHPQNAASAAILPQSRIQNKKTAPPSNTAPSPASRTSPPTNSTNSPPGTSAMASPSKSAPLAPPPNSIPLGPSPKPQSSVSSNTAAPPTFSPHLLLLLILIPIPPPPRPPRSILLPLLRASVPLWRIR